jgi:hypothetical protein
MSQIRLYLDKASNIKLDRFWYNSCQTIARQIQLKETSRISHANYDRPSRQSPLD